jgi:hypothetical protein
MSQHFFKILNFRVRPRKKTLDSWGRIPPVPRTRRRPPPPDAPSTPNPHLARLRRRSTAARGEAPFPVRAGTLPVAMTEVLPLPPRFEIFRTASNPSWAPIWAICEIAVLFELVSDLRSHMGRTFSAGLSTSLDPAGSCFLSRGWIRVSCTCLRLWMLGTIQCQVWLHEAGLRRWRMSGVVVLLGFAGWRNYWLGFNCFCRCLPLLSHLSTAVILFVGVQLFL